MPRCLKTRVSCQSRTCGASVGRVLCSDVGLSGAERGTALHLVMQFLNFEACTSRDGVEAEIARLREQRFLTSEQAEAVDAGKILAFFRSSLGQRMMASGTVRREFKFSLLAPCAVTDDLDACARPGRRGGYNPVSGRRGLLF